MSEHRLVAALAMGRRLKPSEVVHHIDGNRRNNHPTNLLVCTQDYHMALHARQNRLEGKESPDTKRLSITLTEDQYTHLRELADQEHVPVGLLIRQAVDAKYAQRPAKDKP